MQTALKQTVTIEAGGVVFVCSPELPVGAQAEVTILVEAPVVEESTEQKRAFSLTDRPEHQCLLCGQNRHLLTSKGIKLILGVQGGICVACVGLCQDVIESNKCEIERVKTTQA